MNHKRIAAHRLLSVPPMTAHHRRLLFASGSYLTSNSASPAIPANYYKTTIAAAPAHKNRLLRFSGQLAVMVLKASQGDALHGAELQTGKLCFSGSLAPLGTATLISPRHILVARHVLNGHRLSTMEFHILGKPYAVKLSEDGSVYGFDYAILEVPGDPFKSFVTLKSEQPPVSSFALGHGEDARLLIYAEDKPITNTHMLVELNYLPTEKGMSGAVYRDTVTGHGFALHIKRCIEGLFVGQNNGVLVSELLQFLPENSVLSRLCRSDYESPSIEPPHHFSYFSTALATEIDQGVSQIRTGFKAELAQHGHFFTTHMKVGAAAMSMAVHDVSLYPNTVVPLIIEIMAPTVASARAKIEAIHNNARMAKNPMTLLIALNQEVSEFSGSAATLKRLGKDAQALSTVMTEYNLPGACIPFVWIPTEALSQKSEDKKTENRGYVFPFLEARSLLALHPEVQAIHDNMLGFGCLPVVRWMDADVVSDILLAPMTESETERKYQFMLEKVSRSEKSLASGGYVWDTTRIAERLISLHLISSPNDGIVARMQALVSAINTQEWELRKKLLQNHGVKAVYWPEPNLYSAYDVRTQGAVSAYEWAQSNPTRAQQKESVYMVNSTGVTGGMMMPVLPSVKPLKDYFDDFFQVVVAQLRLNAGDRDLQKIRSAICAIRQTHMNVENVVHAADWNGGVVSRTDAEPLCDVALDLCVQAIIG